MAGFVGLTFVAVAVGGVGWFSVNRIDTELNGVTEVATPAIETTDDLIAGLWEGAKVAEEAASVPTRSELDKLAQHLDEIETAYQADAAHLDTLVADPALQRPLEAAAPKKQEYDRLVHELVEARRTQLNEEDRAEESVDAFRQVEAGLITELTDLAERNEAEMSKAEDRGDALEREGASADKLNALIGELFEDDYPMVEASLELQTRVNAAGAIVQRYLRTDQVAKLERLEAEFATLVDGLKPHLEVLTARAESDQAKQEIETVKASLGDWQQQITGDKGLFAEQNRRVAAAAEVERITEDLEAAVDSAVAQLDQVAMAADEISAQSDADAETAVSQATWLILGLLGITAGISALLMAMVVRTVTRPMKRMTDAMGRLAERDMETVVPGTERADELGEMAGAVQVFKDNMIKADQLAREQAEEQKAREARAERIQQLNAEFDRVVGEVIETVASATTELQSTAQSMASVSEETNQQAATVAAAAEQASGNVQAASSAAEELSGSIQEISRQVAHSTEVAGHASSRANDTQAVVSELSESTQKIGEVVDIISDIAEKTNLLALNATIEAARAGDAGKGFAVVANEVKDLANQTSKATSDISQRIADVQQQSERAAGAIGEIATSVEKMNEVANSIASAIEEQNAATGEISSNMQQAASGADEVARNIGSVTQASAEVSSSAGQVNASSSQLAEQSDHLKGVVDRFLSDVRAA
jgi:methyl-accepting chemotaxis protein